MSNIRALRQAGNLVEAEQLGEQLLESDGDNIWLKRDISWVYYDYLKRYGESQDFEKSIEYIEKIKQLNFDAEDGKMLFRHVAYKIAAIIFDLRRQEDTSKINTIFSLIKDIPFPKPSDGTSRLITALLKDKEWSRYIEAVDWFGLQSFTEEDYQRQEYNERMIPSLVERVYNVYSQILLKGEAINSFDKIIDKEKIKKFLPYLDQAIDNLDRNDYLEFYQAKLLLASGGDEDNILESFLPFAKRKKSQFWVWTILAEVFDNDPELVFACYSKALSIKTQNDFLVKTRLKFAKLLMQKNMRAEAKVEYSNVINTRIKNNWRVSKELVDIQQSEWFKETETLSDNKKLYAKHAPLADKIFYKNIPDTNIAITFVNKQKNIINFLTEDMKSGYARYNNGDTPRVGEIYAAKIENQKDDRYNLYELRIDNEQKHPAVKEISGDINIREGNNFGFLENAYVPGQIIKKYNFHNGDEVKGKAIKTFNKKKNEWGWSVITLKLI